MSFYGDYDNKEYDDKESDDLLGVDEHKSELPIRIERGYNKDGCPLCKQVIYGKIVDEYGVPVAGFSMDGSTSDSTWNKSVIEHLQDNYKEMDSVILITDAIIGVMRASLK